RALRRVGAARRSGVPLQGVGAVAENGDVGAVVELHGHGESEKALATGEVVGGGGDDVAGGEPIQLGGGEHHGGNGFVAAAPAVGIAQVVAIDINVGGVV